MSEILVRVGIIGGVLYLIYRGYKWFTDKTDDTFKGDEWFMNKNFKDFRELKMILRTLNYNLSDQELENIGIMLKNNINNFDLEMSIELLYSTVLNLYGVDFLQKNILKCSQTSYYNLHNYLFYDGYKKPTNVYKQLEMFYNIITSYFIGVKDE